MGIDFVQKCARSFERSWDRNRDELAQPNLLNLDVEMKERTYRAIARESSIFVEGDQLTVQREGDTLLLSKEVTPVGSIEQPTQHLLDAISKGNGVAMAKVEKTLVDGAAAEISVS